MDRVATLKRSASKKGRDEQEEGKKDFSALKKAKEIHAGKKPSVEEGSSEVLDIVRDAGGNGQEYDSLLEVSGMSGTPNPPHDSVVTSEIEETLTECREVEVSTAAEKGWDEASSSDPIGSTEIWNAKESAERFAKLRQEILRRHYSHEIYSVKEVQVQNVSRTASGPVVHVNPSDEARKVEFVDEKRIHQIEREAREKRELEPTFVFTAGGEWKNTKTRLNFQSESGASMSPAEAKDKSIAESSSRKPRQDTPYKMRKTSRSRIAGKSSAKLFQRKTSDFFRSPTRMGSHSLENLLDAESPVRTPDKSYDCVQILRNIRASQKAHEEARKLARQHSAAERARLTQELQMIARDCSISNCSSPARESWGSVKSFLSNLFCCGCSISGRKSPESPKEEETSEEGTISSRIEQLRDTARFEHPYALETPVNLPGFPNIEGRQKSNYGHKRSMSCDFEAEKAMTKRESEKKHSD